ncbi:hypothetical protein C8F01DRAFT_1361477 [Mycena amicta]|nr:hypothetical protein C8F01DRAFT_1361477 [Mycena amicta]
MDVAELYVDITVTRYVNAAAFVILLYDHLLTLGTESTLIWPAKFTSAKALFLYVRYVVPCAMILYTIQLSGLSTTLTLSTIVCRWWMGFAAFVGWAAVASSNFLILLRLWVIWDRDRKLMVRTLLCFVVVQTVGLAAACILVWQMRPALYWNTDLRMCAFSHHIQVSILWVPGMVFDIVLFSITWWNALHKPRASNTRLAAAMYRDGLFYFVLLLVLRIINTIIASAPNIKSGLTFVAMFPVLCFTSTTTCRLILKLREVASEHEQPLSAGHVPRDDEMSLAVHGEYDELERSGVQVEMLRSQSVGPSTPIRAPSRWY